jgi:class 3 adenylate cyclase/Tfp pilus assembly protein PilE
MPDESAPQSTHHLERRLATILCADVAGYSKMVVENEDRTVRVFRGHREIFESLVNLHRGRIFNTAGDALLAEFNSAVEAVRCATEIQAALQTRNEHLAPEEKMQFRMGINLGDVIIQGGDLLGDGVNVAARIQAATAPGGICISGSVYDQIQNKLSLNFTPLGKQTYKNIPKPVLTYTINEAAAVTTSARRTRWQVPVAIIAAVLAIAGTGYWGYQPYDSHRTRQLQGDANLAAQLAAQKQYTEQAQHSAEEAKREAQLQTQKLIAEETQRRALEERNKLEQERKRFEAVKHGAEEAKREVPLQAQKPMAEETQRRALEERKRFEPATQHAASTAAEGQSKPESSHDGSYSGQLCTQLLKGPFCWPVVLVVRNGIAEGSWISASQKTSRATGTIAADGSVQLNLSGWSPSGNPEEAKLLGRIVDGAITASGQWKTNSLWKKSYAVSGDWKRTP